MFAVKYIQQVRMERLRAETDAIDAVIGHDGDFISVERIGVGFDAQFAARSVKAASDVSKSVSGRVVPLRDASACRRR